MASLLDIHDDRIVDQNSVLIVKYIMKEKKDEDDNDPDFSMEKHFKKFYLRANPRNLGLKAIPNS